MILIVDDIADGAKVLSKILTRMGYPSQWISEGTEALAIIRHHPPGHPLLVILDEMMPSMTGLEVLRQIRSEPRIARTQVIMFSAESDPRKSEQASAWGGGLAAKRGRPRLRND